MAGRHKFMVTRRDSEDRQTSHIGEAFTRRTAPVGVAGVRRSRSRILRSGANENDSCDLCHHDMICSVIIRSDGMRVVHIDFDDTPVHLRGTGEEDRAVYVDTSCWKVTLQLCDLDIQPR